MRFPRASAIRVLGQVTGERRSLDDAFASEIAGLDPSAHAWLYEICSGTLRWRGRIDLAIESLCEKKKPTGWLKRALQVAAYQLIAQDNSPAAAVVSETVDLVRHEEGQAPASFANAVLRRMSEQGRAWRDAKRPQGGTLEEQAAWASLPTWMWKRIVKLHGEEWAEKFAAAMLDRPKIWIREKGATDGAAPGARLLGDDAGRVPELPGFREGGFFVQDLASQQLVQEFSARAGKPGRALDLCAAPGGKSFGLEWNGWDVFASDTSAPRVKQLRENVARLQSKVRIIEPADVAKHGPYDLVWVDAPCTGTGVIRRHPEIRWNKSEAELGSLVTLQGELLAQARALVAPGGHLAYSVCSILPEEGPGQRGYFLKTQPEFAGVFEKWIEPFGEVPRDGFYGALFKRS